MDPNLTPMLFIIMLSCFPAFSLTHCVHVARVSFSGLIYVTYSSVMITFMCQLDLGPWNVKIKHYFWVCLSGCFWMKLVFESVDSTDCPPQHGWALYNPLSSQELDE